MHDQLYSIELLNPQAGVRQRSGSRKHALRVRRARQH